MKFKLIPMLACALAALTSAASAQFVAAVAPPKAKSKVDTVAKQDSVRHATVALAARVTDMKKWVDSAAGVPIASADTSTVRNDSALANMPKKDSVVLSRNARIKADSASSIATVEVHDSTGLKGDSAVASAPPTSRTSAGNGSPDAKRFTNGGTAPGTATLFPLLALFGASTLLAGAALRRS